MSNDNNLQARQAEVTRKLALVRAFMQEHQLDALLLSRRDNFAWLTCGGDDAVFHDTSLGVAVLLITNDAQYIVFSEIERYRVSDEELRGLAWEPVCYDWHADKAAVLQRLIGGQRAAGDDGALSLPDVSASFAELRYALMPEEIVRYRQLGAATAASMNRTCRGIRPGQTEFEVAASLTADLLARGIYAPVCMVASDARIQQYRHPIPTQKAIDKYALVVVGAQQYGLFASMSRLVCFGKPDDEIARKQQACMDIDARMMAATRVGATAGDVLQCGIEAYAHNGYADQWTKHHQGGATGYLPRDYVAVPGLGETVRLNQAFSWNPTIAGAKSEDTYIVEETGLDILTAIDDWPMRESGGQDARYQRPDMLIL